MGDVQDRYRHHRDAVLGRIAYEEGVLSRGQLKDALSHQARDLQAGRAEGRPLEQILVEEGYLTWPELTELLQALEAFLDRTPAPDFPPFGKYSLLREVGRGAIGVIYEAVDTERQRTVALKMLIAPANARPEKNRPDDERFIQEAELASRLPPHPNIVGVLEAGVIDGKRYLAMEFIEGVPLTKWRRTGSLTMRQHIKLLQEVARAVHHAHEHGLVHRDLKPENILVDKDNQPHITDFGLAKAMDRRALNTLTEQGMSVGTPAYMSPEQIQSRPDVDRRTDVYALGVILYELLTGRLPFDGDSPYQLMKKAVEKPVVPPSQITNLVLNPILYKNLENICLLALAKHPVSRYPDANSLADDLDRWLEGKDVQAVVPKTVRAFRAKKIGKRLALATAGCLVLAALGFLGLELFENRTAPSPAGPASPLPDAASLRPGAVLEVYAGMNFNALGIRKIDARNAFHDPADAAWPEAPPSYLSRRWTGYFVVAQTATYEFRRRSAEGGRVRIDGTNGHDGSSWSANPEETVRVELEEGLHRLELEHYQLGKDASIALDWKREGAPDFTPLYPGALTHDPAAFTSREPVVNVTAGSIDGAQEGESLSVLDSSGHAPEPRNYAGLDQFWRGPRSGGKLLWWGWNVGPDDRLTVRFTSSREGRRTVIVALTHATDHGIFQVRINGEPVTKSLDLYSPDLLTREISFSNVVLKKGKNRLKFIVVGSNPRAREWGPDYGIHKIGIDYIRVTD